jgi:hypothetical protein
MVVAALRCGSPLMAVVARLLFALALLVATPGAALAADADTVVLRNGDRLRGEVKKLDRGRLEFSTTTMGTVYIEWDKVAAVTSQNLFNIELTDGTRRVGSLGPGQAGLVRVALGDFAIEYDIMQIVQIRRLREQFWSRLDGSVTFGASYTQSSGVGQGSVGVDIRTRRERFEASTSFDTTVTVQPNEPESSRTALSLLYSHYLKNRWYVPGTGKFERNTDLGLKLRSSVGTGIGRYLVQTNRALLGAGAGAVLTREIPLSGDTTSNIEAYLGLTSSYFTYDSPKTSFTLTVVAYPSLNVGGRVRVELDTSLNREIVSDFTVGATVYNSYDSKPPTEGAKKNDIGVTLNVGWVF